MMTRRLFLTTATLALGALSCVAQPPTDPNLWTFDLLDEQGKPTSARVILLNAQGKGVPPEGLRVSRNMMDVPYFYATGRFTAKTALTALTARVWKGPEYEPLVQEVYKGASPIPLKLSRVFDMKAKGWYCGDGHIHVVYDGPQYFPTNAEVLEQVRAEGLNAANVLACMGAGGKIWYADRVTGRPEPESDENHIMQVGEEYTSNTYGHMAVYGVRRLSDPLFTGYKGTLSSADFPTNHEACLKHRSDGAFPTFAHLRAGGKLEVLFGPPPAGHRDLGVCECPVDVALGSLNAIEIQGYAVWTVLALPVWESLMGAGFDVTVSAGTDCFLSAETHGPMGGARSYVDLEGRPFDYPAWVSQLACGRGFTTNGAMLFLKVDGKAPGEAIDLKPGETREANVEVVVDSLFPWDQVVVRTDGKDALVFKSAAGNPRHQAFTGKVALFGPSWIYAKLSGPYCPWLGAGGIWKRPLHEAVTNAVWVRRGEEFRRDAESLDYLIRWVQDNLETLELRKNYGSPENRAKVRDTFQRALKVFQARRAECRSATGTPPAPSSGPR